MSNNIAATAMAGVIALVAGVGIGHFGTLQEGMKTSQDVSAQLAAVEIDSAKVPWSKRRTSISRPRSTSLLASPSRRL